VKPKPIPFEVETPTGVKFSNAANKAPHSEHLLEIGKDANGNVISATGQVPIPGVCIVMNVHEKAF
jgi:hypothetical protein